MCFPVAEKYLTHLDYFSFSSKLIQMLLTISLLIILISFFQEAFFPPQHTPFLPEEAWFTLEDVSFRMESEGYF